MENKEFLEVGDQIKRWEVFQEVDVLYTIESVTKTLAKTKEGHIFYRRLDYGTIKHLDHYVAEVNRKDNHRSFGKKYFLIK